MIGRILRRGVWGAFVVWATVTLTFAVNYALPTDPARMIAGPQARSADVTKIRQNLGLDRPLIVQYGRFLTRLLHLAPGGIETPEHGTCTAVAGRLHVDFGKSYQQRRAVGVILAERIPRSLILAAAAAFVQLVLGVTAGALAASRKGTALDRGVVAASLLGVSTPTFVFGVFFQWLFAYHLRWLPVDGYGETALEHLASVVLPALTVGLFGAAYYTRMVRDEMVVLGRADYVRTALAKGLSRRATLIRHVLRNALGPIVTIFGLEAGTLVGGAVVTESIFRWPGIGSLFAAAMLDRDGPVMMGCVIVTSLFIVLSTIAVDVAYALVDPRVREEL